MKIRVVIAWAALLAFTSSVVRAQALDVMQWSGRNASGQATVSVNVDRLPAVRSAASIKTRLPIGETQSLNLELHMFEVIAPDAKFLRGGGSKVQAMPLPEVVLLRGHIANEPASRVFLAITSSGGGSGSIVRANGQRFQITSEAVDPQRQRLVVIEGAGDVPDFTEFCRVVAAPDGAQPVNDGAGSSLDRGPRVLNIAVDADQAYVNLFPNESAAMSYIVQVIGAVSDIYQRDLNMKLILRFARIWPDGGEPFSATNLSDFRTHWIDNENMTGLNLVHLFSGRRDTSYGGIAYLADACGNFGFGISAFLLGAFPSPVQSAHLWNWDVVVIAHEMGHNLGTLHTHDYSPPIDTCTGGTSQRGTIMSYCHTTAGGMLNNDPIMHARVAANILQENPLGNCLWYDCNGNGVDDAFDIANADSIDSDGNGIPDECEDCDGDGVLNSTEILLGAADVNNNGIPDACEPDCNSNNIPDSWEISLSFANDFNGNGIPDSCEPDCDKNGVADFADIANGTHVDIDRNSIPDACQDCNNNGITDWIDAGRSLNYFIAQLDGGIREYHAHSGVFIRQVGLVNGAYDMAFGPDRQLYVTSVTDHRIVRFNVDTLAATTFVPQGAGGLNTPSSVAFGPDGRLYVASNGSNSILRYNAATGAFVDVFIASGSGGLSSPLDMTFGTNGNLFVISGNSVLQYQGSTGAFVGLFASQGLDNPRTLAFLDDGRLLVANNGDSRVMQYSPTGALLGQFNDHYPQENVWVVTIGANGNPLAPRTTTEVRVVEMDKTGRYLRSQIRGDWDLTQPTSIAIRPAGPGDVNRNGIPDSCEGVVCASDIAPANTLDGIVNVQDLLAVIQSWGPCPAGCLPYCRGDVTFDCTVNVADLLQIISAWGPCN